MLGIRHIQEHAIRTANMVRLSKAYERHLNPIWSIDENIEIFTRVLVRAEMMSILPSLDKDTVEELSDVLFNVVYPAYTRPIEV